jgi:hypothetical protein
MKIEDIIGILHELIHRNYAELLEDFLNKDAAPNWANWVIASDYVIGAKSRYRDTFCYTIYPGDELPHILAEIKMKIPNDLKNTSHINDNMIECLRSSRRFSFCFIVRRGQKFWDNVNDIRSSLDTTIEMLKGRENLANQIAILKRLRQTASAKNFNYKLFSDITLASLFAAVTAMFITKLLSDPRTIFWFSDRDKIITSHNHVADDLLTMHFYQACHEHGVRYDSVKLGVGDMSVAAWYDDLIRVPDFLAGALSAFDYDNRNVCTQKHLDLLTKVIADARNIATIETEVKRNAFGCRAFLIQGDFG